MSINKKLHTGKFSINRVIWFLTTSDIFTWGLYMTITPLTGLFLSTKLGMDVIEVVGLGTSIFFLSKGIFQIPTGMFTDRIKKDRDDILFLLLGNLFMGAPYLLFPLISSPAVYYALQFVIGLGAAMNLVTWRKLFAKNLDEGVEGLEYGLYDTILSLCVSMFGVVFGFIANIGQQYFDFVMFTVGALMISSGIWVLSIFLVKNRRSNL